MKKKSVIEVYKKAIRVIDSCENLNQLQGASQYTNNFLQYFSKHTGKFINHRGVYELNPFIDTSYIILRSQVEERRDKLS